MSAPGFTPIQLYYSTTASAVPSAGNLANGEPALNITDGKLYYKNNSGVVTLLASAAGASGDVVGPASATDNALVRFDTTTGKLVQNSVGVLSDAGVLTGLTGLTSSGSITFSSLTSGRVPYATTAGLLTDSANLTFNGTRLTVSDLADSGLTSGRVVYASAGGALVDSANLLYSGTDLTVYGLTVGRGAGAVSTNTALGASALAANTSGSLNTALGYNALPSNTTGQEQIAVGVSALSQNTTGSYNTSIGRSALGSNTTASNNTAVGYQAGFSNTTGQITAVGSSALKFNTTGFNNTAVGIGAGANTTTGSGNVFIGSNAGAQQTTGSSNTYVGGGIVGVNGGAGFDMTTGSKNTIIGRFSGNQGGLDIRTANNYIVLSDGDGNPRIGSAIGNAWIGSAPIFASGQLATLTLTGAGGGGYISGARNALYLRNVNASSNQSNNIVFGSAGTANSIEIMNDVNANGTTINQLNIFAGGTGGVYLASGGTSWTAYSDERLKDIIEPITNAAQKLKTWRTVIGKFKTDADGTRRVFFIAQDVQANTPEVISKSALKDDPTKIEYLGVQYTETIPVVAAAVNEHTDQIAAMAAMIDQLKAEIAALKGS